MAIQNINELYDRLSQDEIFSSSGLNSAEELKGYLEKLPDENKQSFYNAFLQDEDIDFDQFDNLLKKKEQGRTGILSSALGSIDLGSPSVSEPQPIAPPAVNVPEVTPIAEEGIEDFSVSGAKGGPLAGGPGKPKPPVKKEETSFFKPASELKGRTFDVGPVDEQFAGQKKQIQQQVKPKEEVVKKVTQKVLEVKQAVQKEQTENPFKNAGFEFEVATGREIMDESGTRKEFQTVTKQPTDAEIGEVLLKNTQIPLANGVDVGRIFGRPTYVFDKETYTSYLERKGFTPEKINELQNYYIDQYIKANSEQDVETKLGRVEGKDINEKLTKIRQQEDEKGLNLLAGQYGIDVAEKARELQAMMSKRKRPGEAGYDQWNKQMQTLQKEMSGLVGGGEKLYNPEDGRLYDAETAPKRAVNYKVALDKAIKLYSNTDIDKLKQIRSTLYDQVEFLEKEYDRMVGPQWRGKEFLKGLSGTITEEQKEGLIQTFGRLDDLKAQLSAINARILTNTDIEPTTTEKTKQFLKQLRAGLPGGDFASKYQTLKDDYNAYVQGIEGEVKLKEGEAEKGELTFGEQLVGGLGSTIPIMAELALTRKITPSAAFLRSSGYLRPITRGVLKTTGSTKFANFMTDAIANAVQGYTSYGLTSETGATGVGETLFSQTIWDKVGLEKMGAKWAPVLRYLSKTALGTTGETIEEFVGEFSNNLSETGFDWSKSAEETFGKDISDFGKKLALYASTSALLSGLYNAPELAIKSLRINEVIAESENKLNDPNLSQADKEAIKSSVEMMKKTKDQLTSKQTDLAEPVSAIGEIKPGEEMEAPGGVTPPPAEGAEAAAFEAGEGPLETAQPVGAQPVNAQEVNNQLAKEGINDVSLQRVEEYGKEIESGNADFERFSPSEQRGLIEGGPVHVAATIITGKSDRAADTQDDSNDRQEEIIKEYAQKKGIWTENAPAKLKEKYGDPFQSGKESIVWLDEERGVVVKSSVTNQYPTLREALDSITLSNAYFPAAKITVVGFGTNKNGDFEIITEQPYIQGEDATEQDIKDYFNKLGFTENERLYQGKDAFGNEEVIFKDAAPKNVIKTPEGNIVPIDLIAKINKPELNANGTRTLPSTVAEEVTEAAPEAVGAQPEVTEEAAKPVEARPETVQQFEQKAKQVASTKENTAFVQDSVVKNTDGTPLVVYNNTNESEVRFTEGRPTGLFFTTNAEAFSDYGKTKFAAILNLKNPYYSSMSAVRSAADIQKLKDAGYDGVITHPGYKYDKYVSTLQDEVAAQEDYIKNQDKFNNVEGRDNRNELDLTKAYEFIAFDPEQIKLVESADNKSLSTTEQAPEVTETKAEAPKEYGAQNKIVTKQDYDQAVKNLRNPNLPSGFDFSKIGDLVKAAMYHIEAGSRKFADFTKKMVEQFGRGVRQYLPNVFRRAYSELEKQQQKTIKDSLYQLTEEKISDVYKLIDKKTEKEVQRKLRVFDAQQVIAAAYVQAKADGSNPELVKAVEELIGKPTTPITAPTASPTAAPAPAPVVKTSAQVKQEINQAYNDYTTQNPNASPEQIGAHLEAKGYSIGQIKRFIPQIEDYIKKESVRKFEDFVKNFQDKISKRRAEIEKFMESNPGLDYTQVYQQLKDQYSDFELFKMFYEDGADPELLDELFGTEYRQTIQRAIDSKNYNPDFIREIDSDIRSRKTLKNLGEANSIFTELQDFATAEQLVEAAADVFEMSGVEEAMKTLTDKMRAENQRNLNSFKKALKGEDITEEDALSVTSLLSFSGRILRMGRGLFMTEKGLTDLIIKNLETATLRQSELFTKKKKLFKVTEEQRKKIEAGVKKYLETKGKFEKSIKDLEEGANALTDPKFEAFDKAKAEHEKSARELKDFINKLYGSRKPLFSRWFTSMTSMALLSFRTIFIGIPSNIEQMLANMPRRGVGKVLGWTRILADKAVGSQIALKIMGGKNLPLAAEALKRGTGVSVDPSLYRKMAAQRGWDQTKAIVLKGVSQSTISEKNFLEGGAEVDGVRDFKMSYRMIAKLIESYLPNKKSFTDEEWADAFDKVLVAMEQKDANGKPVLALQHSQGYDTIATFFRGLFGVLPTITGRAIALSGDRYFQQLGMYEFLASYANSMGITDPVEVQRFIRLNSIGSGELRKAAEKAGNRRIFATDNQVVNWFGRMMGGFEKKEEEIYNRKLKQYSKGKKTAAMVQNLNAVPSVAKRIALNINAPFVRIPTNALAKYFRITSTPTTLIMAVRAQMKLSQEMRNYQENYSLDKNAEMSESKKKKMEADRVKLFEQQRLAAQYWTEFFQGLQLTLFAVLLLKSGAVGAPYGDDDEAKKRARAAGIAQQDPAKINISQLIRYIKGETRGQTIQKGDITFDYRNLGMMGFALSAICSGESFYRVQKAKQEKMLGAEEDLAGMIGFQMIAESLSNGATQLSFIQNIATLATAAKGDFGKAFKDYMTGITTTALTVPTLSYGIFSPVERTKGISADPFRNFNPDLEANEVFNGEITARVWTKLTSRSPLFGFGIRVSDEPDSDFVAPLEVLGLRPSEFYRPQYGPSGEELYKKSTFWDTRSGSATDKFLAFLQASVDPFSFSDYEGFVSNVKPFDKNKEYRKGDYFEYDNSVYVALTNKKAGVEFSRGKIDKDFQYIDKKTDFVNPERFKNNKIGSEKTATLFDMVDMYERATGDRKNYDIFSRIYSDPVTFKDNKGTYALYVSSEDQRKLQKMRGQVLVDAWSTSEAKSLMEGWKKMADNPNISDEEYNETVKNEFLDWMLGPLDTEGNRSGGVRSSINEALNALESDPGFDEVKKNAVLNTVKSGRLSTKNFERLLENTEAFGYLNSLRGTKIKLSDNDEYVFE